MVICSEWRRTAVDLKSSSSGLPMTGEDTGLGALASPLMGYLGKVQERASSLEHCPWCAAKGSTFALRSYRINLQDSITLCTNPQCLFPLVSRSLEDVLASLDPVEPAVGNKRKKAPTLEEEESMKPAPKRRRSSELEPSFTELGALSVAPETGGDEVNGHMEIEDKVVDQEMENGAAAPGAEEEDSLQGTSPPEGLDSSLPLITNDEIESPSRQLNAATVESSRAADGAAPQDAVDVKNSAAQSDELVPVPHRLFWRNSDNLCWLDSLLVALVNCRSLRRRKPGEEPRRSSVWRLMGGYEDVCAAVQAQQQIGRDGVARVPLHVLQKADADLQGLRMSVFEVLQPKLQCKLGQRETPVFALPLLLLSDSWAEPLLQSTFHWEFSCSGCSSFTSDRMRKTLPTFTQVLPSWRPLHAVHSAPCNVCRRKNQRRRMVLESVPEVFGLHFVDGLPDADVTNYSFTFEGKRRSVAAVIQYDQKRKHFVTWSRDPDGSWLEFDDLKHPVSETHQRLPVPAQEMHLVFWEVVEGDESRACSPSSTFSESLSRIDPKPGEEVTAAADQSRLESHDDTAAIVSALTDVGDIMDATLAAGADTSIGSTTLLDTFEGLSHNDIITLTLVELNPETFNHDKQTEDLSVPAADEALDSAPDSSSAVTGSESPDVQPLASSADDSASDPTFVPASRGGRRRGRGVGGNVQTTRRQTLRKAAAPKAPHVSSPPATKTKPAAKTKPAPAAVSQDDSLPVKTPRQASPESSTDQKSPTLPPQCARWSFLLSKHPLNQVNKCIAKVAAAAESPTPQAKPARPVHSTPNPARRPHAPGGFFPKPQLRTEESDGLPLKAAEMYGGFGGKTSKTPGPLTSPNGKSNIVTLKNVASGSTPPETTSLKKQSLSDTDLLRYKLIKKLKAKKKKLAKLNQMLGPQGGAGLRPDSTALGSPATVSSSTYDGSISDELFSDLLSPATTASNLSPDSTGFLEMLASGQDGGEQAEHVAPPLQSNENFLEEFLSQAVAQRPTDMETEALSALELFI